jgi:2,3-dihydroxyphenylpropionate 1,2-dioxygenase
MMACASHSPLLDFPVRDSDALRGARHALGQTRRQIAEFDPQLVVLMGCDHYGGHQMFSMPAFCVGLEATALADVGGTPGKLNVPRKLAMDAVDSLRTAGVDVAVSYDMAVDHGFSQVLEELAGGLSRYPVLPIFVSCLHPPFVPFARARALGEAVAGYIAGLDLDRVLILGTGGLSHDPAFLFPTLDAVSEDWRPYILGGHRQSEVSQQAWIDYEIAAHKEGAKVLADDRIPLPALGIHEAWDRTFLDLLANGDLADVDDWSPEELVAERGIGTMEVLTWIAATQAMETATGHRPQVVFQRAVREVGVGFGVVVVPAAALRDQLRSKKDA